MIEQKATVKGRAWYGESLPLCYSFFLSYIPTTSSFSIETDKKAGFNPTLDTPLDSTLLLLVPVTKDKIIATTTTDSQGQFRFVFSGNPGQKLAIIKGVITNAALLVFTSNAVGGGEVGISITRPATVSSLFRVLDLRA